MSVKYAPYRLMVAVIVAGLLAFPGSALAQAVQPEKPEKGIASPETLPRGFEQSIAKLQGEPQDVGIPGPGRRRQTWTRPKKS